MLREDDVNVHFARDRFGRWCWTMVCYSIGELSALTMEDDLGAAVEHFRANTRRLRDAFGKLEAAAAERRTE